MYLVIGANGFLGSYIVKNIIEKTQEKIIATARDISGMTDDDRISWQSCDISSKSDVDSLCDKLSDIKEIKVVFLAAYHHPDMVEKNVRTAWNINITSLSYFINRLQNVKCFFYPSTDSVYGNSVNGYHFKESDKLAPVNTYGRQKVAAEQLILWYGYNVIRYPFLISPSISPRKKHFYDAITDSLIKGQPFEMFADSYRSSLSFELAAGILVELIEGYSDDMPKILNVCGDDDLSKYDVGLMIADKLGVSRDLIVPITMETNENIFSAARAQSTLMDNSLVKKVLGRASIKLVL